MYKTTKKLPLNVLYNPERKSTKYSLDGEKWYNLGQINEILYIYRETGKLLKADNKSFSKGSDFEEEKASIKAFHFSLCSPDPENMGTSKEEILLNFARLTPSESFIYTVLDLENNTQTAYIMALYEFLEMCKKFCAYHESDKKIRATQTEEPLIKWLEEQCGKIETRASYFELCVD